ncbi:glycine-rich cell wall structural protein 1.8-like isoform X2 [Plectropomus leopardus]|uniref:glycine-rich cell wall structural protein 1.8-like isoform X2 n=1 Tax=Plectropomus leopardus TaxID=160734 RepID=UPI001C4B535B|nr:glycine-rich cell wall structural protein 1.8-like isoform X2 [Plectropomus leopardus]
MLVQALLQTSLVLWLAQQTLQGGVKVKPQSVSWGKVLPARGVGVGVKPGVAGALGALGNRYGAKAMKTGIGRYPGAQLGHGGYRALGLGGKAGLKQGGYGAQGAYGAALGTGMAMGTGLNGLGLGMGQQGKRAYGAGLGTAPGYGALAGIGYPGARPGYLGGAGNYLGASLGAGGYGAGLGQGAYLGGAAGKLGAATALGQGGYPLGVAPGYGEGATGYLGAMGGNGYGYGNGYSDGQGAALGAGGYAGQVPGALGAGLDSTGAKYGAGAAQVPYGNAPVIPTGLEGDGGYPYPAQQLNLAAEGTKTANKYGPGAGYGAQQTGYGAQLGATQDALGEQAGKYGGVNGALGNGYKGIPLVCFLVLLPLNIPWSQISVTWLGVVHFLACLSPQLGSVLYHLFMNHEGGEPVYHTLLKLDVCGICMINTLGALPIVYSTLLCYPFIRTVALVVYILLSSHAIYCAVTARSSVRRLRSFAWQALFRFSFFLLRWVGVGGGSPTSLRHFLMMDALAVLGGVINITRIPERFRPGLFDYWCNSHQIMHVLVVGSILYLHWGVLDDLLWINSYICPSD